MEIFDLGLAWNWEFDKDFIFGIEEACAKRGVTTYRIEPHNVQETLRRLRAEKLHFHNFIDRASDADDTFEPIVRHLAKMPTRIINDHQHVEHAKDKATMHLELITAGVEVPYTIIISPYEKKNEVELSLSELAHLGRPFIIKPANTTGGGIGVVVGAESLKDIIETRQHHRHDKYLLQETIHPIVLQDHKAWFRVFYAFGIVLPCWWEPQTHVYREVSREEVRRFGLRRLFDIMNITSRVCKLDFFSTEIAMTDHKFVSIDYVNEICDMRLQSKHFDGVPDKLVVKIQSQIAKNVKNYLSQRA